MCYCNKGLFRKIKYGAEHRIHRKVKMTKLGYTVNLKKSVLATLMGLCVSHSCFALEALDDESLSQQTGEGTAFLAENFKMVFQKAEDGLSTATNQARMADRTYDTGLIRIVPVGPLSSTATSSGAKKADAYLYGLALSASDSNTNSRFSNMGLSLGTETNPWVLSVAPVATYNFAGADKNLSYLNLEAPLALAAVDNSVTAKLGLWGDIFSRDSATAPAFNAAKGAPDTTAGLIDRLRLQVLANGLNINGSSIKLFQTLDGSSNTTYNNTLGVAGIIRMNTDYNAATRTTVDNGRVLRISTAETSNSSALSTPAITGDVAPSFSANDGLYLYSPNINLVLGSVYQPLILNTDGTNFSLELTRIPNVEKIYKQIYTDYSGADSTYKGSTCNVISCGKAITVGNTLYQGNTATHSSISIGTVNINNNLLDANKTSSAVGVTFKDSSGNGVNLGSAAIDGLLIQHMKITTTGL